MEVRGALETLLGALTPIAALMNSDLLSRGAENITLLLSLLEEEDFYVRYYTLQILTALLMNSQNRLQEAILTTPRGITRLMDMLMDREVIRNEAFLLLTHLTREAEHHQGGRGFRWRCGCAGLSGVVEKSSSQQFIKPDNQYADMGGAVTDHGKDSNKLANRTVLVQKKLLDHLLMLGVESQWSPVAVRCMTFKCIGDLVDGHPKNRDILASKCNTCCRAASILSHVVKDNIQCKKKALKIVLESHVPSMGTPEPLFQRIVSFIFSSSSEGPREDHEPLTRTATPSEAEIEDVDVAGAMDKGNEDHPMLIWLFDPSFTGLVKSLEERIVDVYSRPKSEVAVVPADLEQRSGESEKDYIDWFKAFIEKQCWEIQNLLARNAALAEDVASSGRSEQSQGSEQRASTVMEKVHIDSIKRELQETSQRLETIKSEKAQVESEASEYKNIAVKLESDLKGLSDAYNSLEQVNYHLEKEVRSLKGGEGPMEYSDVEAIKEEVRKEAQKESEDELNDLLVCLGQEESKVEKLTAKLVELGVDVDKLLEDIGDESEAQGESEDDGDEY
ncbi:hypothetical protein Bca52824_055013 [Brassica carinata]|uniref:Uso1/p115-like vesicle tethering protein C-terminal domain-containing protein n=1 Tax=Brassica carinata TaxID=52824 RepID=A0A8X7R6T3_BRACI|nr:hypothetical protein Bca52824_055013 [Brassica carinata]